MPDADIQVICIDGVIILRQESALHSDDLKAVLSSLQIASDLMEQLSENYTDALDALRQATNTNEEDLVRSGRELTRWSDLMPDSIEGKCVFTPEQVKERMDTVQALQVEVSETALTSEEIRAKRQKLRSWANIFERQIAGVEDDCLLYD